MLRQAMWNSPPESRVSQVIGAYGGAQRRFSSCWSGAGITLMGEGKKKLQKRSCLVNQGWPGDKAQSCVLGLTGFM